MEAPIPCGIDPAGGLSIDAVPCQRRHVGYLAGTMASGSSTSAPQMQIGYIDQSHLSRMAKAELGQASDEAELGLLAKLRSAVESGRLVCPYSIWHVFETAFYDADDVRDAICRILGDLSGGRCFIHFSDQIPSEMLARIDQAALSTGPPLSPIGSRLDCFPRRGIADLTRRVFASSAEADCFAEIIATCRKSSDLQQRVGSYQQALFAFESRGAKLRSAHRLRLDRARQIERESVEHSDLLSEWITRVCETLSVPPGARSSVRDLVLAKGARLPTLETMIEIRARRDVLFDRALHLSDAMDAGHLLALPACTWVLTEAHCAALGRSAVAFLGLDVLVTKRPEVIGRIIG